MTPTKPYDLLGGAEGVRRLVNVFYDIVERDPAAKPLLQMHLENSGLAHAREEQYLFLSGFLGGPQLYFEHHGHANVKLPHAHLKITGIERDAWLSCMDKALKKVGTGTGTHDHLMMVFGRVAEALRKT